MNLAAPTLYDRLSRRVGSAWASAALAADLDAMSKPINPVRVYPYPDGYGVSPRPAPTAASYKPAHGGYPGTPVLRNQQPFC